MSDETTREPRRQAVPPDCEGVWVRTRRWQTWAHTYPEVEVQAFHFRRGASRFGDDLECIVPGICHGPATLHRPGDSWEGPFPVPSLAALSERDRLREENRRLKEYLRQAANEVSCYADELEVDDPREGERLTDLARTCQAASGGQWDVVAAMERSSAPAASLRPASPPAEEPRP